MIWGLSRSAAACSAATSSMARNALSFLRKATWAFLRGCLKSPDSVIFHRLCFPIPASKQTAGVRAGHCGYPLPRASFSLSALLAGSPELAFEIRHDQERHVARNLGDWRSLASEGVSSFSTFSCCRKKRKRCANGGSP